MRIPFFPNTGDGTHCFQAALKMALAVCLPSRTFTYEELDSISGKKPGKWTWPTTAMLWMLDQGLQVRLVEDFDYAAFADQGGDYLIARFGEEVGKAQIEHSDVEPEREIARQFLARCPLEVRVPSLSDLASEIARGAVVIVNVNAAALYNQSGYSGHFVVVTDVASDHVILHDPGMPPRPSERIALERFEAAWAYPSLRDCNFLSIAPTHDASS